MSRSWIAAILATLAAGTASAQEPHPAEVPAAGVPPQTYAVTLPEGRSGVPGTWDLSRDGTHLRCVMTLAAEKGEAGQKVRFPAGCRRALPVVGAVAGWLFSEGTVRLVDRNVRPVLLFSKRPDARSLFAKTEAGEVYSLVPLEIAAMRPAVASPADLPGGVLPADVPTPGVLTPGILSPDRFAQASATQGGGAAVGASPTGGKTAAEAATGPVPAPGIYALDRFRDRDVCRLDLGAGPSGPVRVVPGCRDSGIAVFDPISWRYAKGRMTLTAKRGHTVGLVPASDGAWRRDPETGVAFVLRRVEP